MARFLSAYEQSRSLGWTRIDLILAVYDGIIRQLELARARLDANDAPGTADLLARARIGICALAASAGGAAEQSDLADNFTRLYHFVLTRLSQGGADHIEEALAVLRNLREGFQEAHQEARHLERTGAIPALAAQHVVRTSA